MADSIFNHICFPMSLRKSVLLICIVIACVICSTVEARSVGVVKKEKQEDLIGFGHVDGVGDDADEDNDGRHHYGHGGHGHHSHDHSEDDLIKDLPGAPSHDFKQYSGYVTVDHDHGRKLFYWFVEAETSPEEKPLTLWLNGGPGCSSVAGGALSELGPFYPDEAGKGLIRNQNSWGKDSNLIFLESPAGVGFSYSNYTSDYHTGDLQTAKDSRTFLLGWFKKFPQYKNRTFYISGESYAGHYIPDLAHLLLKKKYEDEGIINFKGFLLGNPWTITESDFKGMVDFWYTRALISSHTYKEYLLNCDPESYWNQKEGDVCYRLTEKAYSEMGDINEYDVYVDACNTGYKAETAKLMRHRGFKLSKIRKVSSNSSTSLSSEYDPCVDDHVEMYLNQEPVQEAIHAAKLPYRWVGCSDIVDYSAKDGLESKWDIWVELLASDLRLTVYSGDVDSVCPTLGTRDWISRLENKGFLKLSKEWFPWYHDKQVGGYTEEYNGGQFRFVTVRDAGHMVPYTQPARASILFKDFLINHSMPKRKI